SFSQRLRFNGDGTTFNPFGTLNIGDDYHRRHRRYRNRDTSARALKAPRLLRRDSPSIGFGAFHPCQNPSFGTLGLMRLYAPTPRRSALEENVAFSRRSNLPGSTGRRPVVRGSLPRTDLDVRRLCISPSSRKRRAPSA